MRNFSWAYFTLTGDVDAYLLFKDMHQLNTSDDEDERMVEEDNQITMNLI